MNLARRLAPIFSHTKQSANMLTDFQKSIQNWNMLTGNGFRYVMTDENYISTVALRGVGGWEHLYIDVGKLQNGKKYKFSFDYTQVSSETTGSWTAFVLEYEPSPWTEDNVPNLGKHKTLVTLDSSEQPQVHISVEFTATLNNTYLDLNFGRITDGFNVVLKFENIILEEV